MEPQLHVYTLFAFRPEFIGLTKGKPQRCTKGHTWDIGTKLYGARITLPAEFMWGTEEMKFCFFCFVQNLQLHCGLVEDIEENT